MAQGSRRPRGDYGAQSGLTHAVPARAEQHQRPESQCGITRRAAHPVIAHHWRAFGVFLAPFFPDATMLITSFNNPVDLLAERFNASSDERRTEYNRIATYQSINDAMSLKTMASARWSLAWCSPTANQPRRESCPPVTERKMITLHSNTGRT